MAEGIDGFALDPAIENVLLLVPVRIQLHPPLLHAYRAVVLVLLVGAACEIGFHIGIPGPLCASSQLTKITPASRPKRRYSSKA
ncbi:hypothetical protein D3C84_669560 [compost metagenome]